MMKLSETVAQLATVRNASTRTAPPHVADRLQDLDAFGANPGNLRARLHVPKRLPERPALVVVLHGCTQTAAGYDVGAGWSRLADDHGFIALFPEQRRANNPNLCFNWFSPADNRRDKGEALSIHEMIARVVREHDVDPARIFVTGLSAGGAMTSVMLATYPELFAGGAIIAGLPYGAASNVPEALERMRGQGSPRAAELGALVRRASSHPGPWPTVSVWHGSGDATVAPSNAEAIVAQWRAVHGVADAPAAREVVDGHVRRVWRDAAQRDVIESYDIAGMGHGTPLATLGADPCGAAGPYMLEAGISSTRRIAVFWGLTGDRPAVEAKPVRDVSPTVAVPAVRTIRPTRIPEAAPARAAQGVGKIIEDALRAAGLMR